MLAKKLSPFIPTTEETLILPNLRKRKTLQSQKRLQRFLNPIQF
jgi:hypothetical protein